MHDSANYLREHRIAYIQLLAFFALGTTLFGFLDRSLLAIPASAAVMTVIAVAEELYRYIKAKSRELRRRESARTDHRRFWLVLHSFEDVGLIEGNWQWRWVDPSDGMDPNLYLVADSVLNRLEDAIADERAIVCIGSEYPTSRSLVLSNQEHWFDIFSVLLAEAEVIVLFPGESDGIRREIQAIVKRGAYDKTIVFMTPLTDWSWDSEFHRRAEAWTRAAEALRCHGFNLPLYDPAGMLFTVNSAFAPQTTHTLGITNYQYDDTCHHENQRLVVQRIKQALSSLRREIPEEGTSLCDSLPEIERIEQHVITPLERMILRCMEYIQRRRAVVHTNKERAA